ncbi:MAG: hypothetical protein AAGI15_07845 [Pseudomonadota bacterium]
MHRFANAPVWVLLLLCPGLLAAQPDLRQRMGEETFRASGLHRLSPAELARLERWLDSAGDGAAPTTLASAGAAPAQSPALVPTQPPPLKQPRLDQPLQPLAIGVDQLAPEAVPLATRIRTRIRGEFEGWTGKTLFRLENGQIWRQRIGGRYRLRRTAPEVEVFKGRFGYYLKLLETGRQVGVRRVK